MFDKQSRRIGVGPFCFQLFLWLIVVIFVGIFAGNSFAQENIGTSGADFLQIEAGPRAVALGGAYSARAGDAFGAFWNPASLGQQSTNSFGISRRNSFLDLKNDMLAFNRSLSPYSTMAFTTRLMHVKDTYRTRGETGESFTNYGGSAGVYYGRNLGAGISLGTGFHVIKEQLAEESAHSFAVDAGIHFQLPFVPLRFGAAAQNIGPPLQHIEHEQPLPRMYRAGMAWDNELLYLPVTYSVDVVYLEPEDWYMTKFGLDWNPIPFLYVRGGISSTKLFNDNVVKDNQLRAGLGLDLRYITLDYAYHPGDLLETQHLLSLTIRWGGELSE